MFTKKYKKQRSLFCEFSIEIIQKNCIKITHNYEKVLLKNLLEIKYLKRSLYMLALSIDFN